VEGGVIALTEVHKGLLIRLSGAEPIHLSAPERQAAAQALAKLGLCRVAWGDGKDVGLLLAWRGAGWARRADGTFTPPDRPPSMRPPGGSAA
jgi:hypothetical protein